MLQHPLAHGLTDDTGKPPTSLLPSTTSSFARTVPSAGHQFTGHFRHVRQPPFEQLAGKSIASSGSSQGPSC